MDCKASVVICTKNRFSDLKRCLESVSSSYSSYPYYELIVVDSSSEESTRNANKKLVEEIEGKYIYEPRNGLSIARNVGISISTGNIIVFGDDDFIVDKDWLKNLIKNYENKIAGCTGRMVTYRNDEVSELYERYMSFDRGNKKRLFSQKDISIFRLIKLATCIGNKRLYDKTPVPWAVGFGFLSFRKEILNDIGNFDIKLGRGTPNIGADDIDVIYSILKKGHKMAYDPDAIVYHNHRQSYSELFKDSYNSGASIKAITTKYMLNEGDIYMASIFIGELILLMFAFFRVMISFDPPFMKMILAEIRGLFYAPIYK